MSDYKNIVEYLDEQNKPFYYDNRAYALVMLVIASTVIPLHTQKSKFLANRKYWLYFDNYRIKLNTNMIRDLLKKKHKDRTTLFKTYLKNNDLEWIAPVATPLVQPTVEDITTAPLVQPTVDGTTTTPDIKQSFTMIQNYKPIEDKGAAWLATPNGQLPVHPDLIKDNIKYMFIDNNATWYLEYCLMISGILASLYLVRFIIKALADKIYTNEETFITKIVDVVSSVPGVLALLYYIDQDYRSPEMLNSNTDWKLTYLIIIIFLLIGYFGIRYIEFVVPAFAASPYQNIQIVIGCFFFLMLWVIIKESVSFIDEKFSNVTDVIQPKVDEKTIQDLIDEQLV